MESAHSVPSSYLQTLRALGDTLLANVQGRVDLFAVELEEQKLRLIQTFIWISISVFTGMLAITFASLTLVYFLWETARLAALGGLTALYTIVWAVIWIAFRRYLARQPRPFAATSQELKEDRACIRPGS